MKQSKTNLSLVLSASLLAASTGLLAGLLTAPRKGTDTRKLLKHRLNSLVTYRKNEQFTFGKTTKYPKPKSEAEIIDEIRRNGEP